MDYNNIIYFSFTRNLCFEVHPLTSIGNRINNISNDNDNADADADADDDDDDDDNNNNISVLSNSLKRKVGPLLVLTTVSYFFIKMGRAP